MSYITDQLSAKRFSLLQLSSHLVEAERELGEFIHPSRYVRGSDVLDVFGD